MMKYLSAVAILIFLASTSILVAQDPNSPTPRSNRFESGVANAEKEARATQAKETIEQALSVLIPGGIEKGSPRQAKFAGVIDSFVKGQAKDALDALEGMTTEDANLPPARIMLAGLTFAVGDNKSGLALLESSAIKHPEYPGVYLSFAQLALNTNRITDASLHADKTARLIESGQLSPLQKKHFLKQYFEIATSIYLRRKQNQKAGETLDQLQQVEADLPFYFFTKAELAFREGQNDQALQFLDQHAKAIESKRLPELTLVDWLKNSGKNPEAEQLLMATLEKNPGDGLTQLMAAQMYLAKEDFGNASMAIEKFEKTNKGSTNRSVDMKGRIAFAGLSYDVAAEHFLNLRNRSPNDPSNANILALCLIESEDPEERKRAQQISQQVASRMSGNALALASLGYIYMKNGETEKSRQLMRRVAMQRQGTPEISFFIANWLVAEGQKEQAMVLLQKAVDTNGLFLYRTAARNLLNKLSE